tara:strand:- start:1727 stop:1903 length:177 start_codon:yes stop_codon:yes gene_type:complete
MPIIKSKGNRKETNMTAQFEMKMIGVIAGFAILEAVGIDMLEFAHKVIGALLISCFAG